VNHPAPYFFRPAPWLCVIFAGAVFACLFASQSIAQHRALIISIDRYADSRLGELPPGLAKNNTSAIQKLLTQKLGYKSEHIKVLQNKQATKSAIINAITGWLGPEKQEKNTSPAQLKGLEESGALSKKRKGKKKRARKRRKKPSKSYKSFLYFSGFGLTNSDKNTDGLDQTLVPYDATIVSGQENKKLSNIVSGDELEGVITKYIRRRTTLVFDAKNLENILSGPSHKTSASVQIKLSPLIDSEGHFERASAPAPNSTASKTNTWLSRRKVTLWSAASPGQAALVAGSKENPVGLFTSAYVKAIVETEADANANGIISNAEVLRYVSNLSSAYCRANKERCTAGLKPQLRPVRAYGRSAWIDRSKVSRGRERRLTLTRLADFLGAPDKSEVSLKQVPPSPLKVGAGNIHYEMVSTTAGHLILLNLTKGGALFQLYPNQYAGQDKNGFAGKLEAKTPLRVPEESYGVSFSATVPAKGHIIAILAPGRVRFGASVNARSISSISPREAIRVYLAELAAALNTSTPQPASWSVVTLPYEILR
jgi:hypothetical protein